jgi:hypothetical protein
MALVIEPNRRFEVAPEALNDVLEPGDGVPSLGGSREHEEPLPIAQRPGE